LSQLKYSVLQPKFFIPIFSNAGFSADWWTTYRKLIAQRQAERISEADLVRLVEMSEAVERANVPRIEALRKLAAMRGCAIEQVMESLGIGLDG